MSSGYGPSEAWMRDVIAFDPWDLLDTALTSAMLGEYGGRWRVWSEFPTPAGRIDLLVAWPAHMAVIEFKREIAEEDAIAQVLRYCGSLESDPAVRIHAIVAAPQFSEAALYAADGAGVRVVMLEPAFRTKRCVRPRQLDVGARADLGVVVAPHRPIQYEEQHA